MAKFDPPNSRTIGRINSDHFALVIEKRGTRAARSGLGVINDLVRRDVADVPLSGDGSDCDDGPVRPTREALQTQMGIPAVCATE